MSDIVLVGSLPTGSSTQLMRGSKERGPWLR